MENTSHQEPGLKKGATPGEAYYIFGGAPHKATETEKYTAQQLATNPLMQFDLKFDSLRIFLDNVATVANQHASLLNKIQSDMNHKVYLEFLAETIRKVSNKAKLNDPELFKTFFTMIEKPYLENTGELFEDSVNSLCNRLEAINNGLIHFNKKTRENTEHIKKNKDEIAKKVYITDFKDKVKKNKKKLRALIETTERTLDEKIQLLEKRLSTKINDIATKVSENEKNTLWRIKDCEDLLKTRISEKYVVDAIQKSEEHVFGEIKKIETGYSDQVERIVKETSHKVDILRVESEDKISGLRKIIRELTDSCNRKVESQAFEDTKNVLQAKTDRVEEKIKELLKRYEPTFDRYNFELQKMDQRVGKFEQKIQTEINVSIENYVLGAHSPDKNDREDGDEKGEKKMERAGSGGGGGGGINIQEMELYFGKYKEEIGKQHTLIMQVQEDLAKKVDIGIFNLGLGKKLDKEEFLRQMTSLQVDEEKFRRSIEAVEDLQNKMEKLTEQTDKKLAKLRKEIDLNPLIKGLKSKADDEHVQKGFNNVDQKIGALSEALTLLKSEIESTQITLKTVTTQVVKFSDNAILSTKAIQPQNCLSCGNQIQQNNPMGQIKGNDGRLYRADFRSSQEVLEYTKHQSLSRSMVQEGDTSAFMSVNNSSSPLRPNTAHTSKKKKNKVRYQSSVSPPINGGNLQRALRPMSAKK